LRKEERLLGANVKAQLNWDHQIKAVVWLKDYVPASQVRRVQKAKFYEAEKLRHKNTGDLSKTTHSQK
jgi:hypothetical protein